MKTKINVLMLAAILIIAFVSQSAIADDKKCANCESKKSEKTEEIKQVNCPVMGGEVSKDFYADYNGKRVYFCCENCVEEFKKNPEKYMQQMNEKGVVLEDALGKQENCPVSGKPINKEVYSDFDGKRVYFCCNMCKSTFEKEPEKYLNEMREKGVELEKAPVKI